MRLLNHLYYIALGFYFFKVQIEIVFFEQPVLMNKLNEEQFSLLTILACQVCLYCQVLLICSFLNVEFCLNILFEENT